MVVNGHKQKRLKKFWKKKENGGKERESSFWTDSLNQQVRKRTPESRTWDGFFSSIVFIMEKIPEGVDDIGVNTDPGVEFWWWWWKQIAKMGENMSSTRMDKRSNWLWAIENPPAKNAYRLGLCAHLTPPSDVFCILDPVEWNTRAQAWYISTYNLDRIVEGAGGVAWLAEWVFDCC